MQKNPILEKDGGLPVVELLAYARDLHRENPNARVYFHIRGEVKGDELFDITFFDTDAILDVDEEASEYGAYSTDGKALGTFKTVNSDGVQGCISVCMEG